MKDGSIDYSACSKSMVRTAVHFLDNVIDANRFPLTQIEEHTLANRKIGLGVMGFADLLLQLGIPYNSDEAVRVAEEVMAFIQQGGQGGLRRPGRPAGQLSQFPRQPLRHRQRQRPHAQRHHHHHRPHRHHQHHRRLLQRHRAPVRASPTSAGSWRAPNWWRCTPILKKWPRSGASTAPSSCASIAQTGSIRDLKEIPKDVRRLFVTAHDITPQWHVRIQAAFQKYTDNAVSKTVNFPDHAAPEDVRQVYLLAYELGLKGITIYRDGSRDQQVLSFGARQAQGARVHRPPAPARPAPPGSPN